MTIEYPKSFERKYHKLSPEIKELAKERILIFRSDPFSPTLKTHKLIGKLDGFWSFSINYQYRIIFEFKANNIVRFHNIGTHKIY